MARPRSVYQCNSTSVRTAPQFIGFIQHAASSTCDLTASANLLEPGCQGFDLIKPTADLNKVVPAQFIYVLIYQTQLKEWMLWKKENICHILYLIRYKICQKGRKKGWPLQIFDGRWYLIFGEVLDLSKRWQTKRILRGKRGWPLQIFAERWYLIFDEVLDPSKIWQNKKTLREKRGWPNQIFAVRWYLIFEEVLELSKRWQNKKLQRRKKGGGHFRYLLGDGSKNNWVAPIHLSFNTQHSGCPLSVKREENISYWCSKKLASLKARPVQNYDPASVWRGWSEKLLAKQKRQKCNFQQTLVFQFDTLLNDIHG